MVDIVPYLPEHLQRFAPGAYTPEQAASCAGKYSWSALHEGHVIGMAGINTPWPTFGTAWALFGGVPLRAWPAMTRKVAAVLDEAARDGVLRIEMTVEANCPRAKQWAERLGFRLFCARPLYGPNATDHFGMVRYAP